jgi:hypothetical protein
MVGLDLVAVISRLDGVELGARGCDAHLLVGCEYVAVESGIEAKKLGLSEFCIGVDAPTALASGNGMSLPTRCAPCYIESDQ